jgi:hypothetical protein
VDLDIAVRRCDEDDLWLELIAVLDLAHPEQGAARQEIEQQAAVSRAGMLGDDDEQSGLGGERRHDRLQRLQAAGRGTDADHQKAPQGRSRPAIVSHTGIRVFRSW